MFSPSSTGRRWRQWAETVVDVADAMLSAEEVRPAAASPSHTPDPFAPSHHARRRPGSARSAQITARSIRRPGTAPAQQPCRTPLEPAPR